MQALDLELRELANAIVQQAVTDYRNALRGISYDKKHSPEFIIQDIENFFHSSYYKMLTKIDGDYLLERLKKEHLERSENENQ